MKTACATLLLLAALPLQAQTAEGRTYTPGAFEGIEIGGSAEVRYDQGAADQVFVEGDADVQKGLQMDVRNGVLRIHSNGAWKFWNSQRLQMVVTSRNLTRLSISGAADVHAPAPVQAGRLAVTISGAGLARFDRLVADQLAFTVSGAGDGRMAGRVRELGVNISGKSDFRGEDLMAGKVKVSVSGIGDVKVWAVDELSLAVAGIGNVDYWGTPLIRRSTSGMASVNDRGPKAALPPLPPLPPPALAVPPAAPAPPATLAPPAPDARPAAVPAPAAAPRPASR